MREQLLQGSVLLGARSWRVCIPVPCGDKGRRFAGGGGGIKFQAVANVLLVICPSSILREENKYYERSVLWDAKTPVCILQSISIREFSMVWGGHIYIMRSLRGSILKEDC